MMHIYCDRSHPPHVKLELTFLLPCKPTHPGIAPSKGNFRQRPTRVRLYYDGPSDTACFSGASFAHSCWRATDDLMVDKVCHGSNQVCPPRASPGILVFICGQKGVLTLLIMSPRYGNSA